MMRHMPLAGLFALALLAPALSAQVVGDDWDPDAATEVREVRLELEGVRVADGVRHYRYRIVHDGPEWARASDLLIETGSPRLRPLPPLLFLPEDFIVDGYQVRSDLDSGRPDLGIGAPEMWSSAIYIHGWISWGVDRYFDEVDSPIIAGDTLVGFELASSAVPAFRRWQIQYFLGPGEEERFVEMGAGFPLSQGWTVGPGWPRETVTGDFFGRQVEAACLNAFLAAETCRFFRQAGLRIGTAEAQEDDRSYHTVIAGVRDHAREAPMDNLVRVIFSEIIEALAARPPSRR